MIVSVSRRTDIPCWYSPWFFNRIKEQFALVRNPVNFHQVSKVNLSPEVVDGIVFWTKNPEPMADSLNLISSYPYYFQFTLTGYGQDVEPGIPDKKRHMIPVFQNLAEKIGRERLIWRFDPVFLSPRYTMEYQIHAFGEIARSLRGYTEEVVVSFLDPYAKIRKNMERLEASAPEEDEIRKLASEFVKIGNEFHLPVKACSEDKSLGSVGILPGCCVSRERMERIGGRRLELKKDRNQRKECGCAESIDIGFYDTCLNGCQYCYANKNQELARRNFSRHMEQSPMLCKTIENGDKITERKVKSNRTGH